MKRRVMLAVILSIFALPAIAEAHPQHALNSSGAAAGLVHPLLGVDHLLAMLTVGLLAAQIGGRAIWALPASFVGAMLLGGSLGFANRYVPGIEISVATSVAILGAALCFGRHLRLPATMLTVAFFGLVHGHAHGTELPELADPALYAAGFVLTTTGLHLAGVVAGRAAVRTTRGAVGLRYSGAAIALAGAVMVACLIT